MVEAGSRKQNPDTGSFSLSHLAQPPASAHILSAVCLANCFFSSRGLALPQSPVICSRASPVFALSSSCFHRMEAGEMQSRNRVTEGRQAAQVGAEDPRGRGMVVELEVGKASPRLTLRSRSRARGSAGRYSPPSGDPPSQMPSLARGGSCSVLRKQWKSRHPQSPKRNRFIQKSLTSSHPSLLFSKECSVIKGMPLIPYYVPWVQRNLGQSKWTKIQVSYRLLHHSSCSICLHPLSRTPRGKPQSLSNQSHCPKAQALCCSLFSCSQVVLYSV